MLVHATLLVFLKKPAGWDTVSHPRATWLGGEVEDQCRKPCVSSGAFLLSEVDWHVLSAPAVCCPIALCSPTAAFGLSKDAAWGKPVREGGAEKASGPFVGTGGRRPLFLLVQDPVGDNLCNHLARESSTQGWIDRVSPQWFTLKWKLRCKH